MRTHGRKRRILLHDSDFRGKFRIVQHFSCRNAVFRLFHTPPNRFFRHFSATTGVHDVARFQKTAENGIVRHLGTQNVPKRPEACNHRKKNASKADSPFFSIYFNALYQRGTKSPRNVTHLDEAGDVLLGYFNTIIYYATSE